jgi:hypothetical protein
LGIDDPAERAHEMAELGAAGEQPGPLSSTLRAPDLGALRRSYQAALTDLEQKVARLSARDPKLGYYRTLVVLTKKVELDLDNQIESLARLYRDLERMHDFVHELYPVDEP